MAPPPYSGKLPCLASRDDDVVASFVSSITTASSDSPLHFRHFPCNTNLFVSGTFPIMLPLSCVLMPQFKQIPLRVAIRCRSEVVSGLPVLEKSGTLLDEDGSLPSRKSGLLVKRSMVKVSWNVRMGSKCCLHRLLLSRLCNRRSHVRGLASGLDSG